MTKMNLREAILHLDENIVEEICWNDSNSVSVSVNKIKKNVHRKLLGRKMFPRMKLAVAVCCLLIMIIPCYAMVNLNLDEAAIVNDENRHLIGTESKESYYIIIDKDGMARDSQGNYGTLEEVLAMNYKEPEKSRLVKSIEDETLMPKSYLETHPKKQWVNKFFYPEIIMVNSSAFILTKSEGEGWNLDVGDCITYKFEKAKSAVIKNQTMIIGYIHNGVLKTGNINRDIAGEYSLTVTEKGIYYIWALSASSDYQTVTKHSVKIDRK